MKSVTSEGNLQNYFMRGQLDIDRLNRKIKSIKSALKVAQRHNEELHLRLKNQKENHQMQIIQLESEYKKYKELYEMLLEKYELRSVELKEYKKRAKRAQVEQQVEEEEELQKQYRDTIFRQEKDIIRLKEENRLLYQQLHEKSAKLKDFQVFISKNYLHRPQNQIKDRSFLANLKNAIESKNEDFDKLQQERTKLLAAKTELERESSELALKLAKAQTEVEYERKLGRQAKEKAERWQREVVKLSEEGRAAATKYQQLLNFTYDAQRDMEQQLQAINKEILRKEHR